MAGQTELTLAHFPAYDSVLGQWLSPDPIREFGGINLYAYVRGHPVIGRGRLGAIETWFGIEGEATTPFGGLGFGVGWTQDHDHPEQSGLSFTIAFGIGANLGVAAGAVRWDDECEGKSAEIDVNIGPVSPVMPFPGDPGTGPIDDSQGGGITYGLGAGISYAETYTGTISIEKAKEVGKRVCDGVSELGKSIGRGLEEMGDAIAGWFD